MAFGSDATCSSIHGKAGFPDSPRRLRRRQIPARSTAVRWTRRRRFCRSRTACRRAVRRGSSRRGLRVSSRRSRGNCGSRAWHAAAIRSRSARSAQERPMVSRARPRDRESVWFCAGRRRMASGCRFRNTGPLTATIRLAGDVASPSRERPRTRQRWWYS